MCTTLDIEPDTLHQVVEATGEKSKSKAVNLALKEYVRAIRTRELRALAGTIDFVDNLKELEELELRELEQMQW